MAYCSVGVLAAVLRHTPRIAKIIVVQGSYFWLYLTSESNRYLNVRTIVLPALAVIHVQIIVHCASRSLVFQIFNVVHSLATLFRPSAQSSFPVSVTGPWRPLLGTQTYFDKTGSVGGARGLENVTLLKDETQQALESYKV